MACCVACVFYLTPSNWQAGSLTLPAKYFPRLRSSVTIEFSVYSSYFNSFAFC